MPAQISSSTSSRSTAASWSGSSGRTQISPSLRVRVCCIWDAPRRSGRGSGGGDDLDPLELLEVQVAGGGHGMAQGADQVGGAVGPHGGAEQDLFERSDRAHLDAVPPGEGGVVRFADRKSTRLNSSHVAISYAVFCLKKKNM